jgi:hypothetical protein
MKMLQYYDPKTTLIQLVENLKDQHDTKKISGTKLQLCKFSKDQKYTLAKKKKETF